MATYTNLGTQIGAIIRAQIPNVNYVYDYVESNPGGYPSISIEAFDGNGEFADTTRNRRDHIFRIIVDQERTKVGPAVAETTMRALVDQLVSVFDDRANNTLNNSCIFAMPIPSKWGYKASPDVDIRTAEILLVATDVV